MVFLCFITSIYKGQSKIDQIQKESLGKSHKRTLVLEFKILAQKLSKIDAIFLVFYLCISLLMGQGQDQQQHPAVYSGGVSRAGGSLAGAFGLSDM